LRLHGWSGNGHRIRCLRCATCGTDFSERANTPLFGLRTAEGTLVSIAEHLADGCGCRATGRLCKVILHTARIDTFLKVWKLWVRRESIASLWRVGRSSRHCWMAVVKSS
jgi:hypothetical protein